MKNNQVNALWFGLIIVTFYTCRNAETLCTPGSRLCIKLRQFNDYQWSTCRSDAYIRRKTNNRHHCKNRKVTYCYYQCMLEMYEANGGYVYDNCRCSLELLDEKPKSSSKSNHTGVIIGTAAAAVILVVGAIFIVGCLLYRRIKKQRRNIGAIQNVAYQSERPANSVPGVLHLESRPPPAYSDSALPQVFHYPQNDYGQPAKYPESMPIGANFQNANAGYSNQLNENVQHDIAPHNLNSNPANESLYEEPVPY